MLKAEQLNEMANNASARSSCIISEDVNSDISLAQLALIECAIYTVGAELIGRLDNLHFTLVGDEYDVDRNHLGYINAEIYGSIKRRPDDGSDTKGRGSALKESARSAEGSKGK